MNKRFVLAAVTMLLFACASQSEKDLEQARFYLDQGDFAKAVALTKPIVEADPDNDEAKFILASSYIGNFALEKKAGCKAKDTGYLGLIACLLDKESDSDINGLKTFERIAPADAANSGNIQTALTLLKSIKKFTDDTPKKDVTLQLLISRVFDISSLFEKVGANSPNVFCNTNQLNPQIDGTPDEYDRNKISASDAANFKNHLEQIPVEAKVIGFDSDFALITRAKKLLAQVNAFGISDLEGVRLLFDSVYANHPVCDL